MIPSKIEYFFWECTQNPPYTFQSQILNDEQKYLVVRSGRQLGKTEVISVKALYEAIYQPNSQILVVSATQRQSDILYSRIRSFAKKVGLLENILVDSRELLQFDNGSEIRPLPAGDKGDKIRGFSPTLLILDEAAFIPDLVFEAIEPSLAHTGGKLWMISTPFGKKGFFYEAFGKEQFSDYHIPASKYPDCYAKGWLEDKHKELNQVAYDQEYEAEFVSDADNFFPLELIKECAKDYELPTGPNAEREYYLGVDPARLGLDETVYTIVESYKDQHLVLWVVRNLWRIL